MMRISVFVFLVISMAFTLVNRSTAQDENREGEADGAVALFGQGNGIRGVVVSAASGSITIRTDDNENYKILYSPNTRISKNREPIDVNQIHPGDMLFAAGQLDNKAKTLGAVFLFDVDAAEVRKAREGFGKTWVAGKVQAIHDLKIVVERVGDKQTQVVAVDENTSFRKRNENITLGEIRIGDFISAQGALQKDIFVATILRIVGPKASDRGFAAGPPGQHF